MMYKFILVLALLACTACGWIKNYDRNKKYLEAKVIPKVVIPAELDEPRLVELMEIPEVIDSRGIAGQPIEIITPQALSTHYGIEQIVIKKLGDERWVFIDSSPATVWPKVLQFWQENQLEIQAANPRQGIIESAWIISCGGETKQVYTSLTSGIACSDPQARVRNKFRLSIEPGIRSSSSEIYLEHRQISLATEEDILALVSWHGQSDDLALETEVLTQLALYLGEKINDPVISVMAIENQGQKAELLPDRIKPILKYKLAFDRTWATVGNALQTAQVTIEDRDRSSRIFYVYYDYRIATKSGFLARLFGKGNDKERLDEHRYLVQLDPQVDAVLVTIMKDAITPANALLAERLLKVIKESST